MPPVELLLIFQREQLLFQFNLLIHLILKSELAAAALLSYKFTVSLHSLSSAFPYSSHCSSKQ